MLIVGPCDAGKTTLFLQLRDGTTHSGTVASMQENMGEFALSTEKVWAMLYLGPRNCVYNLLKPQEFLPAQVSSLPPLRYNTRFWAPPNSQLQPWLAS